MGPSKKSNVTYRYTRERRRAIYEKNAESEKARQRIAYEKKQAGLGKITKRSLMKENEELRKRQPTPTIPLAETP